MPDYRPEPIETSNVQLDPSLEPLIERLSESVHDNWALQRLRQGWVHGEERNDPNRTHPGLVSYRELSEIEKNYDRTTVVETLKAIVALGYDIRRRES